jgi:ribosome-binding factor A
MVSRRKPRQYPRTARLNQLLREILADELEQVDDDRLELLSVVSVDVDADLHRAVVYFDSLQGSEGDEVVLEALDEHRKRLRQAVGRQARIKRVPELDFRPDPAVREGSHIEEILADLGPRVDVEVPDVYRERDAEPIADADAGHLRPTAVDPAVAPRRIVDDDADDANHDAHHDADETDGAGPDRP